MARAEDLRHLAPAKVKRTRILRILEQSSLMTLVDRGERISEHSGDEARRGLDDGKRGDLAAQKHEVPQGKFFIDFMPDALIKALVASTDEHQLLHLCETVGVGLLETLALGGKQDAVPMMIGIGAFDRCDERFGHEHHPAASAIGRIIDGSMAIARKIARIDEGDAKQPLLLRLAEEPDVGALEDVRKETDDGEVDHERTGRSSRSPTRTTSASRSIESTHGSRSGISTIPRSSSTSRHSMLGYSRTRSTMPICRSPWTTR